MLKQLISFFFKNSIPEQALFCQHSIIGDRTCNEDAYGQTQVNVGNGTGHFLIVCDGMGGHVAGNVTSQTLVACFIEQINTVTEPFTPTTLQTVYENAVTQMQKKVKQAHGDVDGHTTLACAWFDDHQVLTLHVGDSRIYYLNPNVVKWRTRDHSVVQMLFDDGEISEADMGTHPDQNKLLKSISVLGEKLDKACIKQYPPLQTNDSLLVCSDGFWEHLSQQELIKLAGHLSQTQLESACLLSQKRAAGKSDNITVLMVKKA